MSVAITVTVWVPAVSTPVAYVPPTHEVVAPLSRRQVTLLSATLSAAVIVAVWLAVELVGVVRPDIERVGTVVSTTIVAVWVVTLPAVSVAMTVIV